MPWLRAWLILCPGFYPLSLTSPMPPSRKPWPMKWIFLFIVLFIVPYTYLTLHFRKPGIGYQPYLDAREKQRVGQVGYRRVTITAIHPVEAGPATPGAPVFPAAGGWPADLRAALFQAPLLPESIGAVFAPASLASPEAYAIEFECTLSDSGQQPGQAQLYLKGSEIFIAPNFERLSDGLAARSRRERIALTLPPGALAPGFYRLTLLGQTASKAWSLQVH